MRYLKNGLLTILGIILIILGIAGLFLPFVQGILLIVIGTSILSYRTERGKEVFENLRERVHQWTSKK